MSFRFFMSVSVVCLSSACALASYEKLAISVDLNNEARNQINQTIQTAQIVVPKDVSLTRYPKAAYHVSLACLDYNHPKTKEMHQRFTENEIRYCVDLSTRFTQDPKRATQTYPAECYDVQLWCHTQAPSGQKKHLYFSLKDRALDGAHCIDKLPSMIGAGGKVDYAHIVLRVGTKGVLRDDWNKIVYNTTSASDQPTTGLIATLDREEGRRAMQPYLIQNSLKTHITVARLNKKDSFSGKADLEFLQTTLKSIANSYTQTVKFNIDKLQVTTKLNKKLTRLDEPISLIQKQPAPVAQPNTVTRLQPMPVARQQPQPTASKSDNDKHLDNLAKGLMGLYNLSQEQSASQPKPAVKQQPTPEVQQTPVHQRRSPLPTQKNIVEELKTGVILNKVTPKPVEKTQAPVSPVVVDGSTPITFSFKELQASFQAGANAKKN